MLWITWTPNEAFEAFVDAEAGAASVLDKDACARHLLSIQLVHIFALQRTPNQILRLLWSAGEHGADGSRVARHGFGASWKLFRSRGEPDDVED